jgi:hypothetical protein
MPLMLTPPPTARLARQRTPLDQQGITTSRASQPAGHHNQQGITTSRHHNQQASRLARHHNQHGKS